MDSKSISRKGVGVQVPSLVPPPGAARRRRWSAEGLAIAVLPTLFAQLDQSRRAFDTFTAAIDRDPARALADECALEAIEALQQKSQDLGWCLGVIAAAQGSNLLHARRERNGLRRLLPLVEEALGGRFAPSLTSLPELAPTVGAGWELAFVIGYLFLCAGRGGAAPCRWELTPTGSVWTLDLAGPAPAGAELRRELLALLPQLTLTGDATRCQACFPGDWLES